MPADEVTVEVYRTRSLRRSQRWAWRAIHSNGNIIATSGEGYYDRWEARRMGEMVTGGYYRVRVVMPS